MFSNVKKTILAVILGVLVATPARAFAKSVQDFEAMQPAAQSDYLVTFLEKMTYDIGQKNPELARQIKDYFVRDVPGKPYSEGLEDVSIELAAIGRLAKNGKVDLSKIQVEGVVVGVVKRRFLTASANPR